MHEVDLNVRRLTTLVVYERTGTVVQGTTGTTVVPDGHLVVEDVRRHQAYRVSCGVGVVQ